MVNNLDYAFVFEAVFKITALRAISKHKCSVDLQKVVS